jgi:hypothetical protein
MASTLSIGPEQQRIEGRTVRDIVEHDPAQVNEVWCRKIFRQLLQSLELQHAMHMPHRAITPDTVVFHDNGEPLLLPSGDAGVEQDEAADLTALARVVHFAITRELVPAAPLRGRALDGYSDSLIAAVDRCMSNDPAERPRSIDELRHILGIVSLGPSAAAGAAMPAAAALAPEPALPASALLEPDALPSFMHAPAASRLGGGLARWQRWAIAAGGSAVLIAIALAVFAELRDSGSYDHIVLTLPQSGEQARESPRAAAAVPPLPQAANDPAMSAQPEPPSLEADANGAPNPLPQQDAPATIATTATTAAPAAPLPAGSRAGTAAVAARPQAAAAGSATYKLRIQPWGIVYVDGVDRGASPPVKRLTLAPGRHTIRIANPNFHDRVLDVDTSGGGGQIAVDFSDEPR